VHTACACLHGSWAHVKNKGQRHLIKIPLVSQSTCALLMSSTQQVAGVWCAGMERLAVAAAFVERVDEVQEVVEDVYEPGDAREVPRTYDTTTVVRSSNLLQTSGCLSSSSPCSHDRTAPPASTYRLAYFGPASA
jgi:hypothetical protein